MHFFTESNKHIYKSSSQVESPMMEDVYSFLDSIKPKPPRDRKTKNRQYDELTAEERKKPDKKQEKKHGLNDNIMDEFEYKDKARKGLLYLLNKLSKGTFCPEISDYFDERKKCKVKEINLVGRKDSKKLEPTKGLRRQTAFDKIDIVKEKIAETKKEEDIFKLNFRTAIKKEKAQETSMNTINSRQMTFNKRKKIGNEKNEYIKNYKNYVEDITEKELTLFYSDKEIEDSKNKAGNKLNQKNYQSKLKRISTKEIRRFDQKSGKLTYMDKKSAFAPMVRVSSMNIPEKLQFHDKLSHSKTRKSVVIKPLEKFSINPNFRKLRSARGSLELIESNNSAASSN